MKLDANVASIPEAKLAYLLDPGHPANGGKARLFAALGYGQTQRQELARDLREQHLSQDAQEVESCVAAASS